MPKPPLTKELALLESEIIETLLAGHHEWRPDLSYPESHSDMQGAVRGLLRMFDVKRRPLPQPLKYEDHWETAFRVNYVDADKKVLRCQFCNAPWNNTLFENVPVCKRHQTLLQNSIKSD